VSIDLDGTLIDTCADLAAACNLTLAGLGLPFRSDDEIRGFIGLGVDDLLARCLRGYQATVDVSRYLDSFNTHYAKCNGAYSILYSGAKEGVRTLHEAGFSLSCVTNKPADFSLPLLRRFGLLEYFSTVVSGDTLPQMKPHPAPLLYASRLAGSLPDEHIHVGDSHHDIVAARAAGCRVCCVPYGYDQGNAIRATDCDGLFADLNVFATQLVNKFDSD
jgi:phosphoglycolate phosphatase